MQKVDRWPTRGSHRLFVCGWGDADCTVQKNRVERAVCRCDVIFEAGPLNLCLAALLTFHALGT